MPPDGINGRDRARSDQVKPPASDHEPTRFKCVRMELMEGTGLNVVVERSRLRHVRGDGDGGEPHLAGEVLYDPVLELDRVARADRALFERNHMRIAHDLTKRGEILVVIARLARLEGPGRAADPVDD
jgi:hypothetical protein